MDNNHYKDFPIQGSINKCNERYLERLRVTMENSIRGFPRTYAVRIDLRLPDLIKHDSDCLSRDELDYYSSNRVNLMQRFMDSLKAKISAQSHRKRNQGKRVHSDSIRYAWCRERSYSENDHYHLVLFFNKDRFHRLGDYKDNDSLGSMIIEAWASALGFQFDETFRFVYFPDNHGYYLMNGKPDFNQQCSDLFYRISYFAKKETKHFGEGYRNFGCSQG